MDERAQILIVDDTAGTRYATSRILRAAGFDVVEAASGTAALAAANQSIDLVLLDVQLPDIHGFDVCRRLREREETALLPVIHLSATFTTDSARVDGLDAGADGYLTHPVEPLVLVAMIRTLLRAKRAEKERRSSEDRFKEIFEQAPIGIALLDATGKFIQTNSGMRELLGRSSAELEGQSLSGLVAAEDRERIGAAASGAAEWFGSVVLLRPDGSVVGVDWHITAMPQSGERLALAMDVTQQQQFMAEREELLRRERIARGEAERINHQKDRFLAMLGHELRNPLAAITMGIELLKLGGADAEKKEWTYRNIERQAAQLAGLLDDLLDSTRISHGKLSLKKVSVPLSSAVEQAVESCREIIDQRGHELQIVAGSPDMVVKADPVRLEQVITNLLTNAAKYTPHGGQIRLESRECGDFVELKVTDDGVGISAADLDEIFNAFAQVGAPGEGLGIGLTLVRQLVELHGGSIHAESAGIGKGSTFSVTLPSAEMDWKAEEKAPSDRPRCPSTRVLLVDDNESAALLLQMLLEERGHTVQLALTGRAGIDAALCWRPELILLDLGLPDISGYEVADQLRKSDLGDTLIAALSGFGRGRANSDQVLKGSFDAHLTKPATIAQIEALVLERRPQSPADPSA